MNPIILLVDDEPDFSQGVARLIVSGFPEAGLRTAQSGQEALDILGREHISLMITDLRMPGLGGQELLAQALMEYPQLTVIVLTGYGSVEAAVGAMRGGAYDFLTKPIQKDELFRAVAKGLERARLLGENTTLRELAHACELERTLIGQSPSMRRLKQTIQAVAASDYTVLVRGESGTGKELVAGNIHALSSRSAKLLVRVNCPAIPEHLLESELFGHVKGAFTGAERSRKGLFIAASGGSILLDEIGDVSPSVQTKLLRVLQEHEIRPVGSSETVKVNVRILATTNQDLDARVATGHFREDLFYRLNVLTVYTPPLRERAEDIPLLATYFMEQSCAEMCLPPKTLSPEVLACLASRAWPGNVRQLQNFIRRLAVFCPNPLVELSHMRQAEGGPALSTSLVSEPLGPYKQAKAHVLEQFTRRYVEQVLERTGGNVSEAARVSGIERVSLQKIMKRLGGQAGGS